LATARVCRGVTAASLASGLRRLIGLSAPSDV
jgi:hypothetical protein